MLDEFLEGHGVEDLVGGLGEAVVDEPGGDFAMGVFGGAVAGGIANGEAAIEAADKLADADVAGGAGEAVAAAGADFAFQETASAEGEQDGFKKLVGQVFLLCKILALDVAIGAEPGELDGGTEAVFGSFG